MIDLTKPLRTEDGGEVRIFATDGGGDYPLIGAWKEGGSDYWVASRWDRDGCAEFGEHDLDLVNVPETYERWLNIYDDENTYYTDAGAVLIMYPTREKADKGAVDGRIACIKIKFTEGEGLE